VFAFTTPNQALHYLYSKDHDQLFFDLVHIRVVSLAVMVISAGGTETTMQVLGDKQSTVSSFKILNNSVNWCPHFCNVAQDYCFVVQVKHL
jgi:hypothetical protein